MDTSHLRTVHADLVALQQQADDVRALLDTAVHAPVGDDHRRAVVALVGPTRRLRQLAQGVAAHVGAAEAVR